MRYLILVLAFVCVGCRGSANISLPSIPDIVLPKKPICIPQTAKCVALPDGWTLGDCDGATEQMVLVPARVFNDVQMRERVLPAPRGTEVTVPEKVVEGTVLRERTVNDE